MDVSEDHKREIEGKIVEDIVLGLENSKLTQMDLPIIADFVLRKIDTVSDHEQMVAFLTELSDKWTIFENIKKIEIGEVKDKTEDKVAENVLNLAKSGQIENAISLAKTMTEN